MTSLTIILILGLGTVRAGFLARSWIPFEQTCTKNQSLSHFQSVYERSIIAPDRLFAIRCTDLPEPTALEQCEWSDWVNDFGGSFNVSWPGKIITGIRSEFNTQNYYKLPDRRFKFRHCSPKGKILIFPVKDFNVEFLFEVGWVLQIPEGRVLTGIESRYKASLKDRNFIFWDSVMRTPLPLL